MSSLFIGRGALLALALGSAALAAPPQQRPERADPLDAAASAPRVWHRSAFKDYRRFDDAPAVRWRDANDTVDRIGGWRNYAREAAQAPAPNAAPASAAAPRTRPPAGGHDGHRH
jgi:hypothetical protein